MALVIGHRGAPRAHTENTVESFLEAQRMGADWVELDVRRTSDGVLVVHHDPALPDGTVICHTLRSELPLSVPTLAEAFDACGTMGVNVEIKNSADEPGFDATDRLVEQTLEVIEHAGGSRKVLVSCFDIATLDAVRRLSPTMPTGYLVLSVAQPGDAIAMAIDGGHEAVNPWDALLDEPAVGRCREAGLAVNVWTVDRPERIAELASWGVDGIITNVPDVARQVLAD